MRHATIAITLALATAAATGAAGAQSATRPFSVGVSGGLSVPTGDAGDNLKSGYNVAGHLGLQSSGLPIGLRFDVAYNRWDVDGADANVRSLAGIANAMLMFPRPSTSSVRPYLSGGLGLYNTKGTVRVGNSTVNGDGQTDLGANVGAGLDFGLSGLSTFVEARYHSVFTEGRNTNFIPVVFGIRF